MRRGRQADGQRHFDPHARRHLDRRAVGRDWRAQQRAGAPLPSGQPGGRVGAGRARTLTVDHVIEASPHVASPALEAALVESRATFGLNARRLIQLDDAGVLVERHRPDGGAHVIRRHFPCAPRPAPTASRRFHSRWTRPIPITRGGMATCTAPTPTSIRPISSRLSATPTWATTRTSAAAQSSWAVGLGGRWSSIGRRSAHPGARVVNGLGYTRSLARGEETASNGESVGSARGSSGGRSTVSSQGFSRGGSESSSTGSSSSGSSGSSGGSSSSSGGGIRRGGRPHRGRTLAGTASS